jgi:hypothetical protein
LVKLAYHLQRVDFVVHLIGAHQSELAPATEVEEVLRLDPGLRAWLARHAIIGPALEGEIGYTHWEAYLALYFQKPFVPIRMGRGTQHEHESILKILGRHVTTAQSIEEVPELVRKALERCDFDAMRSLRQREDKRFRLGWKALSTFVAVALVSVGFMQVSATTTPDAVAESIAWVLLNRLAWLVIFWLGFVGITVAAMSDMLTFAFRLQTSVRNATAWLLLSAILGFCLSYDYGPSAYWATIAFAWLALGFITRRETVGFEEEMDSGGFRIEPDGTSAGDGYYWTRRYNVIAAMQVPDFESKPRK